MCLLFPMEEYFSGIPVPVLRWVLWLWTTEVKGIAFQESATLSWCHGVACFEKKSDFAATKKFLAFKKTPPTLLDAITSPLNNDGFLGRFDPADPFEMVFLKGQTVKLPGCKRETFFFWSFWYLFETEHHMGTTPGIDIAPSKIMKISCVWR